jgi:type IV pilus biogenesis protein CpaD/CtpE
MKARRSGNVLAVAVLCLMAGCARNSSAARGAETPEDAARQYVLSLAHQDTKAMKAATCNPKPGSSGLTVTMQPDKDAVVSVIDSSHLGPDSWTVQVAWTRPSIPGGHIMTSLPVVREGNRYFVCY